MFIKLKGDRETVSERWRDGNAVRQRLGDGDTGRQKDGEMVLQ